MQTGLAQQIQKRLQEKGMNVSTLERKAGLKPGTARNILRGTSQSPRVSNLQAIAMILECTLQDLLNEDARQPTPPESASPLMLDHFSLFRETVNSVLDILEQDALISPLNALYPLLTELYVYASELEPKGVDPKFVQWFIKKNLIKKADEIK